MVGVATVDMLPGGFHAGDFVGVFLVIAELGEEGVFKFGWGGAGNDAGNIHIGIAGAGKAKINHADNFVVFIEKDVTEIQIAMNELLFFGGFDVGVIFINVAVVVFIIKFVKEFAEREFHLFGSLFEINTT